MFLSKHRRIAGYLFIATVISFLVISYDWNFKLDDTRKFGSYRNKSEVQSQRKEDIRQACNKSFGSDDSTMSNQDLKPDDFHALHYDDKNKVIYCEVPKVACSNWKRVLLRISGEVKADSLSDIPVNEVHSVMSKKYLKRMSDLSLSEIYRRLDPTSGYFKFLFVREPYERLVSAYRNKFVAPYSLYFQQRFGRYIVRHMRVNASEESMQRGHDVTFPEFIRFITKKNIAEFGEKANAHWRPVSELCLPCLVEYDFIGKYETMDSGDVEYVLKRLQVKHLSFPPAYSSGANKTANLLFEHYKGIPHNDLEKVKELFKDDFLMFYPGNDSDIFD